MLVYHPAFDVDHACFRTLELLHLSSAHDIEIDKLRILDFLILFPHLIGEMRVPPTLLRTKNKLKARANSYNQVPDRRQLLREIAGVHRAAIGCLASNGMVGQAELEENRAKLVGEIPTKIIELIAAQPDEDREIANFVATEVCSVALDGPNGLKARSELMEFRYD